MCKKIPRFKKSNLSRINLRNQICFQHRSCGLLKYVMFSHAGAVHECELSKLIKTCRLPQFQFSNCHNLYLSQIKFIFVRRRDGRVFELVKLVPITNHWQRETGGSEAWYPFGQIPPGPASHLRRMKIISTFFSTICGFYLLKPHLDVLK